jgi:hypothetical protein
MSPYEVAQAFTIVVCCALAGFVCGVGVACIENLRHAKVRLP